MPRQNDIPLAERISTTAQAALEARNEATIIDVLRGIGWLDPYHLKRWQQGQLDCLEAGMQIKPARLAVALALLHAWATQRSLIVNEAPFFARTPQHQTLRFSHSGDPVVEARYCTRYVSSALPERQRERLLAKAHNPPELVAIEPLNRHWKCHRCGGSSAWLVMETPGPACLSCVGLGDREFLPSGNALLTRRAKAMSARSAVVVRFSRARKRYERQGLLVEPAALVAAEDEVAARGRD